MLRKALALVFVLAGIAASVSCGTTASHYVYTTVPVANQIIAYREDPNSGVLTEISGSPYAVGEGARSAVLHPSGKYMYVANPGQAGSPENDISLFKINAADGTLTEITPRTSVVPNGSQPQLLVMDQAGAFLYVMNTGSNNISVFMIDSSTGALTEVAGSPFTIGLQLLNMQITPSGNYLYVSVAGGTVGTSNGSIAAYSVNAGVLTLIGVFTTAGVNPYGLAVNAAGTYLYASNYGSNSISVFQISPPNLPLGSLGTVQGSPIADGYSAPVSMIFDPSGSFLYVANQVSNNIAAYSIDSSGLPTALTTSTTTNAFATESSPSFLVADPNGKYLLIGNQGGSAGIQSFRVNSGSLTLLSTNHTGNTPTSIVVLETGK